MNTGRLLILSCSQRKRPETGLMPAMERYDGPAYRVLRKHAREAESPPMWVLSAEYGLIPSKQPIPVYDRLMTPTRAKQLRNQVASVLDTLAPLGYSDVLICAGQTYAAALENVEEHLGCKVASTSGSLGRQLATLRDWLYGEPPALPEEQKGRPVVFRGERLSLTVAEVFRTAREQAGEDPEGAKQYAGWVVPVGELRVAPKWLLSKLSGVPVSAFRTADARRVLTALGLEVVRPWN
ncbi:MAG: DUF6884 domain-containing protein [Bacteroidota bacterium]